MHPLLDTRRHSLAMVEKGSFQARQEALLHNHSLQSPGSYLFWALDQCIEESAHIVDTGIWDVSMAEGQIQ